MLRYLEVCLSGLEVPGERSICIYISGCCNRCPDCHYPALQQAENGDLLKDYFEEIITSYLTQATCICFLGEGRAGAQEMRELAAFAKAAGQKGLKTCLYSGRDVSPEKWMLCFDFIKTGSYQKDLGPLSSPYTNQRFYQNVNGRFIDITKDRFGGGLAPVFAS